MIPLLVDLEREWRGGQNQFLLLLKGLYERGHAAELLTARGSSLGHRASKAGFCVHYTQRNSMRLPAAMKVWSLLRDGRFDLVHVNESHALTAVWMARAHRQIPLLVARRVGYPLGRSPLSRARFGSAMKIIANSKWVAEQAIRSGAAKEKVCVIYEGAEIPDRVGDVARQAGRARWGIAEGGRLLGCAGVLQKDKGQEWVIRALALLRREHRDLKLLLAGDGSYRAHLEKLTLDLGMRDAVIFAGFVKDIESFYRAIDLFVFPALFEGLGTSLLAAMAHGIPSVTYFGCALGEIVENGKSGLQVEPCNAAALAEAIGTILRDGDFASQLARAGRERIRKVFTAERMVEETLRLYHQVSA
jgi:glycogen(starch) synthase